MISSQGRDRQRGYTPRAHERGPRALLCEDCTKQPNCLIAEVAMEEGDGFVHATESGTFEPRETIFGEGTPIGGLYQVCSGAVKLYHSDPSGRDHILAIGRPGTLLGELPRNPSQTYSVSAAALTRVHLRFLPREPLERLVQAHPRTALRLISALSDELAATRRKVRDLALKGAQARLAGLLRDLAEASGCLTNRRPFVVAFSRRDLAEMIGVSTETAIRLLGGLRRDGAIVIQRREMIVANPSKLRSLADPERDPGVQAA